MIRRHSLVWLNECETAIRSDAAREWQHAGLPFMVCRTRPGEELSLGFCLPLAKDAGLPPRRIAVPASLADVDKISRPPDLREISEKLNLPLAGWDPLKNLPQGCTVRLIGSRLWEVLTGDHYVRSTSDLDVVVDLNDAATADAAAHFLNSASRDFSVPLDGELSFPGRGEVHWKEWLSESPQLLLKAVDRVALVHRAELAQTLPPHA